MTIQLETISDTLGQGTCVGSLTVSTIDEFRSTVTNWLSSKPEVKQLILEMSEVDLLDSSGLGGILAMYKIMQEREGEIIIAALSKKTRMVFEITKANEIFEIFDTAEEAIAASK